MLRVGSAFLAVALSVQIGLLDLGTVRHRILIPRSKGAQHAAVLEKIRAMPAGSVLAGEYSDLILRSGKPMFFNDLAMYQVGPPAIRALFDRAVAERRLAGFVLSSADGPPGYRQVSGVPRYSDPTWALTQTSVSGPFLYLRDDLSEAP